MGLSQNILALPIHIYNLMRSRPFVAKKISVIADGSSNDNDDHLRRH